MSTLVIRDLKGMDEFLAAEALQRAVWGEDDTADPGDLMMVIQHEGGLVAGAFDGDRMVGYVFGFPTRDPQVQHSHRLAVLPQARGGGLALRLKRYQRAWCLSRGITLVRWTFDPLRHTNAHLNIGRLGAEVSTYFTDYYGEMKGINAGLPSDRLLVEWRLDDAGVVALAAEAAPPPHAGEAIQVPIPADLDALIREDYPAALAARMRVRDKLTGHFAGGYAIRGYDPQEKAYLLFRR